MQAKTHKHTKYYQATHYKTHIKDINQSVKQIKKTTSVLKAKYKTLDKRLKLDQTPIHAVSIIPLSIQQKLNHIEDNANTISKTTQTLSKGIQHMKKLKQQLVSADKKEHPRHKRFLERTISTISDSLLSWLPTGNIIRNLFSHHEKQPLAKEDSLNVDQENVKNVLQSIEDLEVQIKNLTIELKGSLAKLKIHIKYLPNLKTFKKTQAINIIDYMQAEIDKNILINLEHITRDLQNLYAHFVKKHKTNVSRYKDLLDKIKSFSF